MAATAPGPVRPMPDTGPFGSGARVIAALARTVEIALEGADLTLAQYRILSYLAGQPSIPTHLARWLGVRKQSMSRQLDVLVEHGYLERSASTADRRQVIYAVTPDGIDALHRTEDRLGLAVDGLLSVVDERKANQARRGVDVLSEAMARMWEMVQRGDIR